jgi:hypothetical protein
MIVDQRIAHALKRIPNYLADSEAKSYEEWPESERHNHIYHDALIVRDWLNGARRSDDTFEGIGGRATSANHVKRRCPDGLHG